VTVMTAMRALRPGAPVADATRTRVLAAVRKLGYHPQPGRGRPRLQTAAAREAVEVVMGTGLHSEFYARLLSAIEQELSARGLDCILRTVSGDLEGFLALCETFRAAPSAPTMIVGYLPSQQLASLLKARPGAVLVDHTGDPALDLPYRSIGFDNAEAARLVTRHLLETGRKRILLVNGTSGHYFAREILQGYRQALESRGIACDPGLVVETDFTVEQAVVRVTQALERGLAFDAVFSNDEMAVAVMGALARLGRRVPDDIAVAGCDGLPVGSVVVPSLTTARLDYVQLGRMAVKYAFDGNAGQTPVRVRLLPELVVRESTQGG